jgi:ribosomal protein RSM22 (predicted rRNA methylase)
MELPPALRQALEAELQALPAHRLRTAAAELIERYRSGRTLARGDVRMGDESVLAYAAYRMPATFGAISAVLGAASLQATSLEPQSLLDVGGGTGAGFWAAASIWPSLQRVTVVDRDERMISLGRRLAAGRSGTRLPRVEWHTFDLTTQPDLPRHDVVLAAYVLNEIPVNERTALIEHLWSRAAALLVVVEPGTPVGFAGIREARSHLLRIGARMVAPCPHERACPMAGDDWCHFSTRVGRSRIHRLIKGGELPYEDEKFSYLAVAREPGRPIAGRLLRHPQILKRRVQVELCGPHGLETKMYTKGKQRELYRAARDLNWGDAMPSDDQAFKIDVRTPRSS